MVKLDQSEQAKSNGTYALCLDILPTLSSNLSLTCWTNNSMWILRGRFMRKGRRGNVLSQFLRNATCSGLMNNALIELVISSHDSPPPPSTGNGGRRRTCLREMCWLKSIEVEDKKIIWRKVSLYFGIFSRNLFILNSGFYVLPWNMFSLG